MLDAIAKRVPMPPEIVVIDGIRHCAKCGKKVETILDFMGEKKSFPCICDCERKKLEEQESRITNEEKDRNRHICFSDMEMCDWTFENDDMKEQRLSNAMKKYSDNFEKYLRENKGLLLYGSVGTGKSYYAAAICNRVIDNGFTAKMTNFQTIINQMNNSWEGRNEYIHQLCSYSLLVLDDLGTERQSEYMQEQVYNIVNARYVTKKPLIVTTNIDYMQLLGETEVGRRRIYDRLIENCMAVGMKSTSRRVMKSAQDTMKQEIGL